MNAVRTHSRDDLVMFFLLLLSVGADLTKGGDGLAWPGIEDGRQGRSFSRRKKKKGRSDC